METGYWLGDRRFDSLLGKEIILLSTTSRSALGPTQPPTKWAPEAVYTGSSGWSVKLTNHLHLTLSLKLSSPPYAFMEWFLSDEAEGQLNFDLCLLLKIPSFYIRSDVKTL
jgi:hypothetical protein